MDSGYVIALVIASVLIGGFVGGFLGGDVVEAVDYNKINQIVAANRPAEVVVPSVDEIAKKTSELIVLPEPGEYDDEKVDDLWENLYSEEIEALKDAALEHSLEELEDDDYEKLTEYLEGIYEGFDELKDVDVDEEECKVVELGLKEDEDKVAKCEFELKFRYTLEDGEATSYKDKMYVTSVVEYEDGDLEDEDVSLVYVL